MPTQSVHQVPSNVGVLTILAPVRTNRPTGLRKPYEYILPKTQTDKLYNDLRQYLKSKSANHFFKTEIPPNSYQMAGVSKKSLAYGMKLNLFLLAFAPGLIDPNYGISQREWQETTNKIQELLTTALGPDAELYSDLYSKTKKFQARYACYIAYKELL